MIPLCDLKPIYGFPPECLTPSRELTLALRMELGTCGKSASSVLSGTTETTPLSQVNVQSVGAELEDGAVRIKPGQHPANIANLPSWKQRKKPQALDSDPQ